MLIWSRLRGLAAQVAALAARIEAGRHRRYPSRRPPRAAPRRHLPRALPQSRAWLLPLVPEAASGASQLRHLLAEADMAALLDAAPQMRRLLRPLCRMLGVRLPPGLAAPPAPPPARAAAPRRALPAAPLAAPMPSPPRPPPVARPGGCGPPVPA